jgi:hypothetical protein
MQKAQFCLLTYKVTPCRLQSIQGLLIKQASWQAAPRILAEEEKALNLPTQHFNPPQPPFDSFEDSDTNTDKIQSPKETKTQATESPKDTKTESETSNLISQNPTENKTKTQESTAPLLRTKSKKPLLANKKPSPFSKIPQPIKPY